MLRISAVQAPRKYKYPVLDLDCIPNFQSRKVVKMLAAALLCLQPTALVIHSPPAAGFIHAARPTASVKLVATSDLGAMMLTLMDKWVLDDEISKPFDTDVTADACMVPIELECVPPRAPVHCPCLTSPFSTARAGG